MLATISLMSECGVLPEHGIENCEEFAGGRMLANLPIGADVSMFRRGDFDEFATRSERYGGNL